MAHTKQAPQRGVQKTLSTECETETVTSSAAPPRAHPESDDYVIYLINMTNLVITRGCYNFNPKGKNAWFVLPTTPNNCLSDCDTCQKNQQWTPILNVSCKFPINLTIATNPDDKGSYHYATFPLTPDCGYAGGGICITPS
jgi:hypothetical protein